MGYIHHSLVQLFQNVKLGTEFSRNKGLDLYKQKLPQAYLVFIFPNSCSGKWVAHRIKTRLDGVAFQSICELFTH